MFDPGSPCCQTLADVLAGPQAGAEPAMFLDDDDVLTMVVAMIDTPGGLGLFDHAVRFCPFCGTALQTEAEIQTKATS